MRVVMVSVVMLALAETGLAQTERLTLPQAVSIALERNPHARRESIPH